MNSQHELLRSAMTLLHTYCVNEGLSVEELLPPARAEADTSQAPVMGNYGSTDDRLTAQPGNSPLEDQNDQSSLDLYGVTPRRPVVDHRATAQDLPAAEPEEPMREARATSKNSKMKDRSSETTKPAVRRSKRQTRQPSRYIEKKT